MDLGRGAASRAADGLALLPPFAPAAKRGARTTVLSTQAVSGGSAHAESATTKSCHNPRLQRSNRFNRVVLGPYSARIARQRRPSRQMKDAADHASIVHARLTARYKGAAA